jgi:uncharacterized membrane protein
MTTPTDTPATPEGNDDHRAVVEDAAAGHVPTASEQAQDHKIRQAELAISLVLRIGVGVAVALVLAGLVVVLVQGAHGAAVHGSSYKAYTAAGTPFPHSIAGLRTSLAKGEGQGIIELGLVVLILTPILRVAVGVLTFLYEGDVRMALITLFVLLVLLGSFVAGGAA